MMPRLLLLVALIALVAVVLNLTGDESGVSGEGAGSTQQTGYYLRDATFTEYGVDGHIRLQFAARTATQNLAREAVDLESVSLDYYALPGQRWRLTADRGHAPAGLRTVGLEGNVVMTGQQQEPSQAAVVHTERLVLDTSAQRATTDAPVTLAFGEYSLAATGLQADLRAETLRLESGVNGRFTP